MKRVYCDARVFPALAVVTALMTFSQPSKGGSATWRATPASGVWNNAANWTPTTVPNGPSDTATFASSNTTGISLSDSTEVAGITFNAGASAFAVTRGLDLSLTISGAGITNNSRLTQNFSTVPGDTNFYSSIEFINNATAVVS